MKNLSKKIFIAFMCMALVFMPVLLTGCSGAVSNDELNKLLYDSASLYYPKHTDIETYEDTTYHWTERDKHTETVTFDYKTNATDETSVPGTFTNQSEENTEYFLAIKKVDNLIVLKLTITRTATSTNYDKNEDDVLVTITETTTETDTYRLIPFTEGTQNVYGVVRDYSTKVNDEDAVITHTYTKINLENFTQKTDDIIRSTNNRIRNTFFEWGVYISYYSNMLTATKNGNKTTVGIKIGGVNVDSNYEPSMMNMQVTFNFVGKNIGSAKGIYENYSQDISSLQVTTIDISNTATVETISGDITEAGYTIGSLSDIFNDALVSIPAVEIGM